MSRAVVFLTVLTISLAHPAFPYLWAGPPSSAPAFATGARIPALGPAMLRAVVRASADRLSSRERIWTETRVEEAGRMVDRAAQLDEAAVSKRVGAVFTLDPTAIRRERRAIGAWWSEYVVVRIMVASTPFEVSTEDVLRLRKSGSSWGEIAHGLGFELRSFVSVARSQCRVVAGMDPAGSFEKIRRRVDGEPTAALQEDPWLQGTLAGFTH